MPEYRHGALYVIEHSRPRDELLVDLKRIDQRLFFERQLTFDGEYVWCVVCQIEGDHPPVTLLEWRDEDGAPIAELSSGILDRVQRMERDTRALIARVREQNERRRRDLDRQRDEQLEDLARDLTPRIQGRTRPVLPRGQHLRMARDKRRARGERA